MNRKKLYKSSTDKKLAGVCGGIADYFDVDSTLIRLAWIIAAFALGTGLLAYIICALVMPDQPANDIKEAKVIDEKKDKKNYRFGI